MPKMEYINENKNKNYINKDPLITECFNYNTSEIQKQITEDIEENELVYSKYKFIGKNSDEITINKGAKLKIIDWNAKDGYVLVYQVGNKQNMGLYPINLITSYNPCIPSK